MKPNNNVRETWAETVTRVGLEDPRMVCIVSDISHFRMQGLAKERPNQYFNLGVCENTIVNIGAGLAMVGKIPVLHTFASFLVDRSFEQLKLAFGYQSLGGNIVVIGSGIEYAFHGVTHHSYVDAALVKSIEGSKVFNPGSSWEFDKLFRENYDSGSLNLFRATTHSSSDSRRARKRKRKHRGSDKRRERSGDKRAHEGKEGGAEVDDGKRERRHKSDKERKHKKSKRHKSDKLDSERRP